MKGLKNKVSARNECAQPGENFRSSPRRRGEKQKFYHSSPGAEKSKTFTTTCLISERCWKVAAFSKKLVFLEAYAMLGPRRPGTLAQYCTPPSNSNPNTLGL